MTPGDPVRMRRAFTLIELLTIIVIIGTMVGVAVLNFRSGQDAARLKGSVRDAFATIRHARSMALLSKQPSIITYSTVEEDGEQCARIEVHTAKIFSESAVTVAETLDGETIRVDGSDEKEDASPVDKKGKGEEDAPAEPTGGQSVEEMLFEPLDTDMFRGISLKVIREGDDVAYEAERAKPKISVFSNVDFLLGKFNQAKEEQAKKEAEAAEKSAAAAATDGQSEESFVWEVNGRTEPHKVWFYRAGTRFDEGLCISVDRFGAAKVLSGEEDE